MQQLAILIAVLLLLSFAQPLLAAEPQERVRESLDAVAAVLKDPNLQGPDKQAERKQRVRQIILGTFDFAVCIPLGTFMGLFDHIRRALEVTVEMLRPIRRP